MEKKNRPWHPSYRRHYRRQHHSCRPYRHLHYHYCLWVAHDCFVAMIISIYLHHQNSLHQNHPHRPRHETEKITFNFNHSNDNSSSGTDWNMNTFFNDPFQWIHPNACGLCLINRTISHVSFLLTGGIFYLLVRCIRKTDSNIATVTTFVVILKVATSLSTCCILWDLSKLKKALIADYFMAHLAT